MSNRFSDGPAPLTSPHEEGGGSRKRFAAGQPDHEPGSKRGPGNDEPIVLLRIACPVEKSGPVIGKGGEVIRSIRDTTGARVKMDDVPRGMHERAIIIFSPDRPGEDTCPAQEALDRVLTRIFEPDEHEGKPPPERAELALLLDRIYMGIIVGKGGESVTRIRTQWGVTVQIQSKGKGSVLEGPDEATVVIAGPYPGVRGAARAVIDKVRESVQRDNQPHPSTLAIAHTGRGMMPSMPDGNPPPFPMGGAPGAPPSGATIHTEYRMLVPDQRVGSIIGKGGDRLRILREESRANVQVERQVEGSDERMVVCSSWEPPEHEYCAAAEGLMMCANRVVMDKTAIDAEGKVVLRLLAPSSQMGAVLGVKGSIIRQVSMDTGAQLVILPAGNNNRPGSTNDEVLEITGHPDQVMEATRIATMLLRGIMIRQQQAAGAGQYGAPPQFGAPPPAQPYAPPGQYAPPAQQQYQYPAPAPAPAPAQSYPYPPTSGAPAGQQAPYDAYTATYGAAPAAPAASAPASQAYPAPSSTDPYAAYYASYAPTQGTTAAAPAPYSGSYTYPSDPSNPSANAPPPQSGYSYNPPAAGNTSGSAGGAAYNPYSAPLSGAERNAGGGSGPPPANPPIGSLHNPAISSTGLPAGMVRYTLSLPIAHVGTLLGTRGSNVSAIRLASGARIKVHDNNPSSQEREVEISGQPAQVSVATTAIQTLVSTGKMPSNIPH